MLVIPVLSAGLDLLLMLDDTQESDEPLYQSHAFTPPIGPMPQACPSNSPMREEGFEYGKASKDWDGTEMPRLPDDYTAAFVRDSVSYLDICKNRSFLLMHEPRFGLII